MVIQHNIMAINSHRQLTVNNSNLAKNLEKLSSGYRINKAADDAAGLAISEKMRAQITGLDRAILNAQDGASLIQTAEGALTEVHSMLNRMVELATQSANGTIQADDRQKIESELGALKDEIDRISEATNFNGIKLLNGSISSAASGSVGSGLAAGADLGLATYGEVTAVVNAPTSLPAAFGGGSGNISVAASGSKLVFSVASAVAGDPPLTKEIDLASQGLVFGSSNVITVDLEEFGKYQVELGGAGGAGTAAGLAAEMEGALSGAGVLGSVTPSATSAQGLTMQVGDTADSFNMITVSVADMSSSGLGIDAISMADQTVAAAALGKVRAAIEKVSVSRGDLGALQNRLEHTIANLGVTSENMTAAESRIRDVDMAKEMMAFTKNNVLSQAAQAMLAQANQQPQQVLQLLR